ncbi:unnamed protein product [Orchesella dallaii]|uniref:C2H2-type domain-containing protein n=1 Tax=Orchesella dallaii TaxID=48710 RepID=A0ABP1PKQ4_9HEXA
MSQNFVSIANNKNVSISTPTTQVIPPMPMPRREIKLIGKSEVISLNSVKVAVKKELNLVPENEEFQENVATVSATSFDPSSLFLKPQYDDLVPGPSHLQNDLLNSSQPSYLTSEDDATSSSSNQTNVIRMLDDSDPRCSKFYRGRLRRYACRICIAEENSLKMLLVHLQLHEEGSGAIPCPECGWFVMPNKLQHHHGHHHKHLRRKPPKTTPKLWYYQCPECNALLTQIERYREHEAMHEQGEGVICPEEGCGWLVKVLGMHRERWHLKDGEATRYKVKHSRKIKIMKKRIHKPLTTPMAKPRRKKKKAGNAVEQKLMSQPALAVLPDF